MLQSFLHNHITLLMHNDVSSIHAHNSFHRTVGFIFLFLKVSTDNTGFSLIFLWIWSPGVARCRLWICVPSTVPTNCRVTFDSCSAAEVRPMSRTCEPVSHWSLPPQLCNKNRHLILGKISKATFLNGIKCYLAKAVFIICLGECVRWHQTWCLTQGLVPTVTFNPPTSLLYVTW